MLVKIVLLLYLSLFSVTYVLPLLGSKQIEISRTAIVYRINLGIFSPQLLEVCLFAKLTGHCCVPFHHFIPLREVLRKLEENGKNFKSIIQNPKIVKEG